MTDQPAPPPPRLFPCTPTRLATFSRCPRLYRHTYLDRPRPPRGPVAAHSSVGASVHAALAAWWSESPLGRTPATAARLLAAGWLLDGFRDAAQSAAALRMAQGWVRRYVATLDPAEEPRGVERVVAARTRTLAFSGRIDRLDDREGELAVVDYKTGRQLLSVDDARGSQALALYAVAAGRTLRQPCRQVELHHLPSGTVSSWVHAEPALQRQVVRAEAIAEDVVAATDALRAGGDPDRLFPTVVSRACSWCDVVRSCPAGLAAGEPRPPWAALAAQLAEAAA